MSTPKSLLSPVSRPDLEDHLLGVHDVGLPGPLFVFVGGMHGNEPAGVLALQELLEELEATGLPLRGRLVCFAGNLEALRLGERFLDADFNRLWSSETLDEHFAQESPAGNRELVPRDALLEQIESAIAGATEPVVFLDLHSTSAGGSPFSIIGDTRANRRIALELPVPVILGLEENVDGALLGYFGERGHVAIGFEGGQHEDPQTMHNHVAAAWLTLIAAGGLAQTQTPRGKASFDRLRSVSRGNPGVVEMRYRHHVNQRERFEMLSGFTNFDAVLEGQLMAHEDGAEVRSRESGLILLPLYQGQGQDGFFIGREVRRFWLRVSSVLRFLRVGRMAHLLPGIRRVPARSETLEINPVIARWWVIEIFHLLGFRRLERKNGRLRFSRRVEGLSV